MTHPRKPETPGRLQEDFFPRNAAPDGGEARPDGGEVRPDASGKGSVASGEPEERAGEACLAGGEATEQSGVDSLAGGERSAPRASDAVGRFAPLRQSARHATVRSRARGRAPFASIPLCLKVLMENLSFLRAAPGRLRRRSLVALSLTGAALLGACTASEEFPDEAEVAVATTAAALEVEPPVCDAPNPEETSTEYTAACVTALELNGPEDLAFDCDDPDKSVEVPDTHPNGANCDRPNVLNGECDKESRFQVVRDVETKDRRGRVQIVAHCRKRGHGPGQFEDIAMIGYNSVTGDTCFWQNTLTPMSGDMRKRIPGTRDGDKVWQTPNSVSNGNCIACHDNGPFVRSPYLSQLKSTPPTVDLDPDIVKAQAEAAKFGSALPGSREDGVNKAEPYRFVGKAFQGWKTYGISLNEGGGQNKCLNCHRMGLSKKDGNWMSGDGTTATQSRGTTMKFSPMAVGDNGSQPSKNDHGNHSPIWMTPGQVSYLQDTKDAQARLFDCGQLLVLGGTSRGCAAYEFGQGSSCRSGAITATINGVTSSAPTTTSGGSRVDFPWGPDIGFMGWRTLFGPFRAVDEKVRFDDPAFDGSYATIGVAPDGHFFASAQWHGPDAPGGRRPPGGTAVGTRFAEIVAVPNPQKCGGTLFGMEDFGERPNQDLFLDSGESISMPTTFVGNVSSSAQDAFGLLVQAPATYLQRRTAGRRPFEGVAMASGCGAYTPRYVVRNVRSQYNVRLTTAAQTDKVRCFLTGIEGDWTLDGPQPFAEIYLNAARETWLRVGPVETPAGIAATASCIELRP